MNTNRTNDPFIPKGDFAQAFLSAFPQIPTRPLGIFRNPEELLRALNIWNFRSVEEDNIEQFFVTSLALEIAEHCQLWSDFILGTELARSLYSKDPDKQVIIAYLTDRAMELKEVEIMQYNVM